MKKIIVFFTVLAVILFSQAAYAEWGEGGGPEGPRHEKMENFVKSLNLTPEQQEQLKQHREQSKEKSKEIQEAIKEKRKQLREILKDPNFDEAKARQVSLEAEQLKGELSDLRIDGAVYMRSVLTPEQYAQFVEKIKQGREKMKEKRKGREGESKEGHRYHQGEGEE